MSPMISHTAKLTPLDSRLSPIMHHISSPGSELIKVVGRRGRWDERRARKRRECREGAEENKGGRERSRCCEVSSDWSLSLPQ